MPKRTEGQAGLQSKLGQGHTPPIQGLRAKASQNWRDMEDLKMNDEGGGACGWCGCWPLLSQKIEDFSQTLRHI